MLPRYSCAQFAPCNEYDGKCQCPAGFGGEDCSEPGQLESSFTITIPLIVVCSMRIIGGWEGETASE